MTKRVSLGERLCHKVQVVLVSCSSNGVMILQPSWPPKQPWALVCLWVVVMGMKFPISVVGLNSHDTIDFSQHGLEFFLCIWVYLAISFCSTCDCFWWVFVLFTPISGWPTVHHLVVCEFLLAFGVKFALRYFSNSNVHFEAQKFLYRTRILSFSWVHDWYYECRIMTKYRKKHDVNSWWIIQKMWKS